VSIITPLSQPVELFERSRLLVDLDEATDPTSPETVLVVVGMHGLGETFAEPGTHPVVAELRERFAEIVGDAGAVYRTRVAELCAILDGGVHDLAEVLGAVHGIFVREAARLDVRVSTGFVELPREADNAPEALALADRRVTAGDGPIRGD
jgi:hypothetical protein